MIQLQTAQQPPQSGLTAELYSQLEDYLALGKPDSDTAKPEKSHKKRKVIKRKSNSHRGTREDNEGSVSMGVNSLAVKINGKTVCSSAERIVGRMVEAEMGASFQEEALKAQAVAAYTYVRYHNQKGEIPSVAAKKEVSDKVADAVEDVIGQAIYYDNEYIDATYSASNAGRSMDAEHVWGTNLPYLLSVESPGDTTLKAYGATKTLSEQEVADAIEDFCGLDPYRYSAPENWFSNPEYINGLYVDSIDVCGQRMSGRKVREELLKFKINSSAFEVSYNGDSFTFTTYGYGHGVGMSQQGADYFAQQGWSYMDILNHYYSNVEVR